MAMWRSVILAPLTLLLFSVILTDLHLLVVILLEGTGTRVGGLDSTDVPGFGRNRGSMLLRLRRSISGTPDEGIYWCGVKDATETNQTVYVRLYNSGGGIVQSNISKWPHYKLFCSISGQIIISALDPTSDLNGDSPQFSLTCISSGGPATTVTWTRDFSTTVTEGTETVLDDPVTAQYTHTLNVTATGKYKCTVANGVSSSSAYITLRGSYIILNNRFSSPLIFTPYTATSPPASVTAVQHGLTDIIVTWTASDNATGYRIYYIGGGGDSGSIEIGGNVTSLILSGLMNGETYNISIVSTAESMPASTPITRKVTVGV